MTHTAVALTVLLAFTLGVSTGYVLGRAVHLERDTPPPGEVSDRPGEGTRESVGPMRRILEFLTRRSVLSVLVAVALLLSAAGTFLNVSTAGRVGDLVECVSDYNRAAGEARDERAITSRQALRNERRLWVDLRAQFLGENATRQGVIDTIERRIRKLDQVLAAQADNPYPDPAACDDGRFEGTEDSDTDAEEVAP